MIQNFEEVKRQLAELSGVINSFKAESVQLRIIEIVLGGANAATNDADDSSAALPGPAAGTRKRRRKAKSSPNTNPDAPSEGKTAKRSASGAGAIATLNKVFGDGFFKKARVIGDILSHCEINLARKIKSPEISGKLGRMVREGQLKRQKNADGQYEYTNA